MAASAWNEGVCVIELLHMDCMEYLRVCEDNAFELAIVDPPYGLNGKISQGSGKLKNRAIQTMNSKWDSNKPSDEYFTELRRVSKNQIIWGGNYFNLPPTRGVICWDKMQPWENFSQWEMAWTSFDRPASLYKKDPKGADKLKIHPTQKPLMLYQWLLNKYAKEGDRILDTHLGSGSSAIAAHYGGFDFVGMELDESYYDAACKRFDQETAQMAMVL